MLSSRSRWSSLKILWDTRVLAIASYGNRGKWTTNTLRWDSRALDTLASFPMLENREIATLHLTVFHKTLNSLAACIMLCYSCTDWMLFYATSRTDYRSNRRIMASIHESEDHGIDSRNHHHVKDGWINITSIKYTKGVLPFHSRLNGIKNMPMEHFSRTGTNLDRPRTGRTKVTTVICGSWQWQKPHQLN